MTVSTRLSSHTKSSLAKASPPRQKPKKSSGDSGNSNETSVKKSSTVVQTENGTPKLQHSRAPSRKTSTFVTAVEERIAEAKEKRNEKPKFPAVPKFQSTEISPKNKPITEGPMLRDDFTLGDGISCEEEHLFRPSLEFKFEFKGDSSHLEVLSKSLDRKDVKGNGRFFPPAVSIDLEELNSRHTWSSEDFPGILEEKISLMGENSPVSVFDFRQDLLHDQPETPMSPESINIFKEHSQEKKSSSSRAKKTIQREEVIPSDETYVPGYFVGISSELAADIGGNEQDLEYVQHVLQISGFGGFKLPAWFSASIPVNPTVFEHLELEIAVGTTFGIESFEKVNHSDRYQRKLLFDAVNEALAQALRPFVELSPWVQRKDLAARPCPIGCDLLEEVWLTIQSWPITGSDDLFEVLDEMARRDMSSGNDTWIEIGKEEADVVFELEKLLLDEMIEELIDELGVAELNQSLCETDDSDDEFPVIF